MSDAPHEAAAAFEAVLALIHLINNPAACRKRLSELADAKASCKAAIELARKERTEVDAKLAEVATQKAELKKLAGEVQDQRDVLAWELHEAAQRRRLRSDDETARRAAVQAAADGINRPTRLADRGLPLGATITQEFHNEPRARDPHYGI